MEQQELAGYARLGRFLDGCAALDRDVELLLRGGWNTSSARHVITDGVLPSGARTRHQPARTCRGRPPRDGPSPGATALRDNCPRCVGADWATEDWLNKFTEPVPAGSMKEPNWSSHTLDVGCAIEAIAPDMALEGRRLYQTVKVMHSFVHGGAH